MSETVSMYKNLVPVTPQRHGNYAIQPEHPYGFTQHLNALPLMAVEFGKAARHYSIIFTGSVESDTLMPAVLVGVKQENLYLNDAGQWAVNYVPAFVRQYPFTFARDEAAQTLTLCVDEGYTGCNPEGQGNRLFNDSEPSEYLQKQLNFLKQYQTELQRTQQFCRHLQELNLLEPLRANLTLPSGEKVALQGFLGINRDRLKELSSDQLTQLMASNELELIYLHLLSMENMDFVYQQLSQRGSN
jgi:hypothetical protein